MANKKGVLIMVDMMGSLNKMFTHTDAALTALDLACGISSELLVFPETRRLKGLHELHMIYYEMSYHLITARGALRWMLCVEPRSSLFFLASSCLMATLEAAKKAPFFIEQMKKDVSPAFRSSVNATEHRTSESISQTEQALNIAAAIAGPRWPKMVEEIGRFQKEIREIRENLGLY